MYMLYSVEANNESNNFYDIAEVVLCVLQHA